MYPNVFEDLYQILITKDDSHSGKFDWENYVYTSSVMTTLNKLVYTSTKCDVKPVDNYLFR